MSISPSLSPNPCKVEDPTFAKQDIIDSKPKPLRKFKQILVPSKKKFPLTAVNQNQMVHTIDSPKKSQTKRPISSGDENEEPLKKRREWSESNVSAKTKLLNQSKINEMLTDNSKENESENSDSDSAKYTNSDNEKEREKGTEGHLKKKQDGKEKKDASESDSEDDVPLSKPFSVVKKKEDIPSHSQEEGSESTNAKKDDKTNSQKDEICQANDKSSDDEPLLSLKTNPKPEKLSDSLDVKVRQVKKNLRRKIKSKEQKNESDSDSSDNEVLPVKQRTAKGKKSKPKKESDSDSADEVLPVKQRTAKSKKIKPENLSVSNSDSSEDDKPLKSLKHDSTKCEDSLVKSRAKRERKSSDSDSSNNKPLKCLKPDSQLGNTGKSDKISNKDHMELSDAGTSDEESKVKENPTKAKQDKLSGSKFELSDDSNSVESKKYGSSNEHSERKNTSVTEKDHNLSDSNSDSSDEPLVNLKQDSKSKVKVAGVNSKRSTASNNVGVKRQSLKGKKQFEISDSSNSSDAEENTKGVKISKPLKKNIESSKKSTVKPKKETTNVSDSSSSPSEVEEEHKSVGKKSNTKSKDKNSKSESSKKNKLKEKTTNDSNESDSSSSPSEVGDEYKSSGKKSSMKSKDKNSKSESKVSKDPLRTYKKYLHAAGLRIQCYAKFFKDCKSAKSRKQKLLSLMEEKGLKGNPTMEKCRALKRKLERENEIKSLDVANIIADGGRGRRNVFSKYASARERSPRAPKSRIKKPLTDSESESDNESDKSRIKKPLPESESDNESDKSTIKKPLTDSESDNESDE